MGCSAAQAYNQQHSLPVIFEGLYVEVDESRARRIAEAYELLPEDDRSNPLVAHAYCALAVEIEQQWRFALDTMAMRLEPWKLDGQPYADSAEMSRDVRNNRHLFFYQGGNPHPLLCRANAATGLSMNDKFRAIHDLFGHAAEGFSFGPRGEENAWIKHSQMFGAAAQKALTTETRGQNSWVNFGAHNYDAAGNHKNLPLKYRPYAVQKVGLLPTEFTDFRLVICPFLNYRSEKFQCRQMQ